MAHESFEDPEIARILNRAFVSVKVDREERPDIDSIYMAACQAFTGSGGWPTSIFMTAGKKPFFAGTYFPKTARYGSIGFKDLLLLIEQKWEREREGLLRSADEITALLRQRSHGQPPARSGEALLEDAMEWYRENFDPAFGGFGPAPKFPTPHNLLFLMQQYEKRGNRSALEMAETTLKRMYAGGLFDHIGYGFCRYSTDRFYLVPHFEKMLYDNALLILAYCRAHELTARPLVFDGPVQFFGAAPPGDDCVKRGRSALASAPAALRRCGQRYGQGLGALQAVKRPDCFLCLPGSLLPSAHG